jgi:hypothetical protein
MSDDATWQSELVAALQAENVFITQHPAFDDARLADELKPSLAEAVRAVDNIRAWRTYLPGPCVTKMMEEGWQWST